MCQRRPGRRCHDDAYKDYMKASEDYDKVLRRRFGASFIDRNNEEVAKAQDEFMFAQQDYDATTQGASKLTAEYRAETVSKMDYKERRAAAKRIKDNRSLALAQLDRIDSRVVLSKVIHQRLVDALENYAHVEAMNYGYLTTTSRTNQSTGSEFELEDSQKNLTEVVNIAMNAPTQDWSEYGELCDGGAVGGDIQVGTAWSRRFARINEENNYEVKEVSIYATQEEGSEEFNVQRQIGTTICKDYTDPGSTEILSDYGYEDINYTGYNTLETADEFAKQQASSSQYSLL